ncbi:MAG: peptidase domain-containing ABC transporter [Muribaculaceae bacterium]|nr:peptidase domain-containing ABC transporter [Muribaculaceae bacterium]
MGFRLIRQQETMQCGAACLAMVCNAFGADVSLRRADRLCGASKQGVSMLAISRSARTLGLDNATVRTSIERLPEMPLPCILHWNQNHYVVLYKVSGGRRRFHIADPGMGKRRCTADELREYWISSGADGQEKGIAMFFDPTDDFGTLPADEDRGSGLNLGIIRDFVKQHRKYFVQILAGLLLGSLMQLVMPFLTQAIVDVGIRDSSLRLIWLILLGELMIVVGRTSTEFVRRWLLLHLSMRINLTLLNNFFRKLMRLPMSFFDIRQTGDILQRMADQDRVCSFLTGQFLGVIFTVISLIVFGVALLIYSRVIFAVFVLMSLVYAGWVMLFLRRRRIIDYENFSVRSRSQNMAFNVVNSMQEIKLQNCQERRRSEWEDLQLEQFEVQMKSLRQQQTQEGGALFINELRNILITVLSATAVIDGGFSLGAMLAVQYIIGQLNSPIGQLIGFVYSVQDVKISLERINEIHSYDDEDLGRENADLEIAHAGIEFRNVCFRYEKYAPQYTLDDVTFDIPEGKVTAIVGASGSGKTTILKLLLGYYKAEEGQILVSGRSLDEYNMQSWRSNCGVVMQDGVIFTDTIARNIAAVDGDVDVKRLEYAARMACIHDTVMAMPLKYNTMIGRDGMGLSQGQKQRILIARAIYRNPRFIFLDEATNALDASNEKKIIANLDEFFKGRTVVVIAHRLSTVRNADRILVTDKGRIVESGTHDTLVAARGVYYNLVRNQLELGS